MRILLRTSIQPNTGFGRDGIGLARELLKRGHQISLLPVAVDAPVPPEIAELLCYPVEGVYDLELHHTPPTSLKFSTSTRYESKNRVLWTMWEWDSVIPRSAPGFSGLYNLMKYDHVVGYTEQTINALREGKLLKEDQNTHVVQGGFDPDLWNPVSEESETIQKSYPPRRSVRGDTFRFGMVGHLGPRKNVYTILSAFNELCEEKGDDFDAVMWINSSYPLFKSKDSVRVRITNQDWNDDELQAFYWSLDCYVNCSWGEAKDLPSIEATMSGVPVLINDTPGHRGWTHPGIHPLLPSTKASMDGQYSGRYTSKYDIKEEMWRMYNNRLQNFRQADKLWEYVYKKATWSNRVDELAKAIGISL